MNHAHEPRTNRGPVNGDGAASAAGARIAETQDLMRMLLRYDPYLAADRLAAVLLGAPMPAMRIPMDAIRRGDRVELRCDLPGVDPGSVAVAVADRILTVRAERRGPERDGDETLELECSQGLVARDVLLGDDLDAEHLEHDYRDGVLVVQIPVRAHHAVTGTDA